MTDFTLTTDADGVATITWDVAAKSMNVMSTQGFADLEALFDEALADPAVKGIILTSAKKDFAGGMDLNIIARMKDAGGAQAVFDGVMGIHRILRKIERAGMDPKSLKGGKPIVAALPGTALGIGLELPLSCHRIIAADNPWLNICRAAPPSPSRVMLMSPSVMKPTWDRELKASTSRMLSLDSATRAP